MTTHEQDPGHGNSIAAWTAVIVAIIGTAVLTLGVLLVNSALTVSGAVISVASIVIGPILAKLGFGVNGKKSKA
ncbi:MAG: hypothetical protein KGQ56_02185 [Acidobacteria bacterium]|nr:hypothetical protein [Acidobacteriota bacterium]NDC48512.1 hypothetical protein [Micrococcales bacterium]